MSTTTTITPATAVDIVARPGGLAVFVDGHRVTPARTMRGPVGAWAIVRITTDSVAVLGVETSQTRAAETAAMTDGYRDGERGWCTYLPIVARSSYAEGYRAAMVDGRRPGENTPLSFSDASGVLYGLGQQAGWQDRQSDGFYGESAIRPVA